MIKLGVIFMKKLIAVIMLACLAMPVWAEPPAANNPTRVEVNEEAHTVTIFIDGRPVAKFTKDGLLVSGNLEYGGTITDVGKNSMTGRMQSSALDGAGDEGEQKNAP